jgi:glycosyltransferase involved in cell wall biosynthesis
MRILLISDYAYPAGGAELMINKLREELSQRRHEVTLFSTDISHAPGDNFADHRCFGTETGLRTPLQVANPSAMRRLKRLLRDFKPDVVHIRLFLTQLSPLILPLLNNIPSLYHVAWYRPVCPIGTKQLPDGSPCKEPYGRACWRNRCLPRRDWPLLMAQMAMLRRWRPCLDRVVANSREVQTQLLAGGFGPVDVVHNGIPERAALERCDHQSVLCFTGRLVPEKGTDVLVRAMQRVAERLPQSRLLIAGDGPERNSLRRLSAALGLSDNIHFLGKVSNAELPEVLRPAIVQVVPSLWAEPFGVVAVEAMMRGQAVVASNHGGLSEIVEDGKTGLLVPPGDEQALADALLSILQDPVRARSLGDAAHARAVQEFGLDRFCDRFEEIYREMAGNIPAD